MEKLWKIFKKIVKNGGNLGQKLKIVKKREKLWKFLKMYWKTGILGKS